MNKIVKISNPMLIGAMELVKKNNTPENCKVFIDEMLHAKFLSPVIITPTPALDENGKAKLSPESKISVPMLTAGEGKRFFMVFTDLGEMKKINTEGYMSVLPFTFKDYAAMIAQADETCQGLIINPYSNGLVVNKEMIASIMNSMKKPEAAKTQAEAAEKQPEPETAQVQPESAETQVE